MMQSNGMGYKLFKDMAEVLAWTKSQFPGQSFSLKHLEENRYMVIVKGKNEIQRQVVYVKSTTTS